MGKEDKSITVEEYFKKVDMIKIDNPEWNWKYGADAKRKVMGGKIGRTANGKIVML